MLDQRLDRMKQRALAYSGREIKLEQVRNRLKYLTGMAGHGGPVAQTVIVNSYGQDPRARKDLVQDPGNAKHAMWAPEVSLLVTNDLLLRAKTPCTCIPFERRMLQTADSVHHTCNPQCLNALLPDRLHPCCRLSNPAQTVNAASHMELIF